MKLFSWYTSRTHPVKQEYFFAYRISKDPSRPSEDGWDLISQATDNLWMRDWVPKKNFDKYFIEDTDFELTRIQKRVLIRRLFWFKKWD